MAPSWKPAWDMKQNRQKIRKSQCLYTKTKFSMWFTILKREMSNKGKKKPNKPTATGFCTVSMGATDSLKATE